MTTNALAVAAPIPQPKPLPVLGNVLDLAGDAPIQKLMEIAKQQGPVFRMNIPGNTFLIISSQPLVAELSDEARFHKKLSMPLRHLRPLAGDGLFTAEHGEPNWEKAHRMLLPAFNQSAMKLYFDAMLDVAETLVGKWSRLPPGTFVDVADNMTRLTLDTIALCGFGYRFNSFYQREMHPFVDAMVRGLAEGGARARRVPLQTQLMFGTKRQFERDLAFMFDVVDDIIKERRAASPVASEQKDLLGLMMTGRDPATGEGLSDVNIRFQMITFLIAGHETTSGWLSFAIHQLLGHPEIHARAVAEVDRVLGGSDKPTFEQIHQLTYLDQILRETLRLYPTAPAYSVTPYEDTTIGGKYPIKKGETVLILTPSLHRDPTAWPDPEKFDPERFSRAAREQHLPHSYKPFGSGQRACIGRQFAMQESLLVMAMLLSRFELESDGAPLVIKETLTLKPDNFRVQVRARKNRPTASAAPRTSKSQLPAVPVSKHGTPLLFLFGSNAGSSEGLARKMAADASAQGYATTVAPMDARKGSLPREGGVVVVTASYNGLPPDNAKAFCAWLPTLPPGALEGVRFTVFGCGHRDWAATFQSVPNLVDRELARAGATRLAPLGAGDAREDFHGDFERWYAPLFPSLAKEFGVGLKTEDGAPRFQVERASAGVDPLHETHGAKLWEVLENRELVDLTSPFGRSKRHLALKVPEGATYRPGDHLSVLPENSPDLVARAARRFSLSLDDVIVVKKAGEVDSPLPFGEPIAAGKLLARYVELSQPATRRDLAALAKHTRCPPHQKQLLAMAEDGNYPSQVLEKRRSVLDLLEEFPACELPFALFLELLPPMKPRRYSISSSPRVDPSRCTLTVAVVDAPAWSGKGRFEGTASGFLARLAAGQKVAATVRPPHAPFFLPEDSKEPVIFVGAGTGMAPFRGFVEDRAQGGGPLGPALFFFGCDHPDVDFLYRDELSRWQQAGAVEVFPAFFKAERNGVTFVQHRLWEERAKVAPLLAAGARIYVCGDGRRMAPAVKETFVRIHREATGADEAAGAAWMSALEREGRYRADVFAG